MAYNASYTDGDIAGASINTIVKGVLTVGTMITIIVIVMLYVFVRKKLK